MRKVLHFVFVLPKQPRRLGNPLEAMPTCREGLTRFGARIMLYHFK
jgi:hypothetical protein